MPYGRKPARSRNTCQVKSVTDSARTFKTIELDFNRADWDLSLRSKFNILPVVHRDDDGEIVGMNTEYICLRARPRAATSTPLLEVDGIKFPINQSSGWIEGIDDVFTAQV
ncbi:unnamed protein product [Prorocentrum cordatum]|uniref:Uncharacterized protein n=1 Tax=Prorocentrum cordatum TaxID=2364126 RepID=A0ABN9RLE5_9DINO|nr:unnamed protein product [Polarella glacialis]